ncbi:MAG: response regulator [Bacteroidales bacterium]|nr:response regulator [Bacteroidales bacterium]
MKNKLTGAYLLILGCGIILIYLFLSGGARNTGILWFFAFPAVVISFLGYRIGYFLSILLFLMVVLIFIFKSSFPDTINYDIHFMIRFIGVYLLIFSTSYFFDFERHIYTAWQEKSIEVTKQENKRKDDFLSSLSHQIRTPLNNLTMVSNLIDRNKLDAEHQDLIDTIIASTNNLINVVNNIVKVSKVEIDQEYSNKISFDLYSTIDNTLKLFRNQYKDDITLDLIVSDLVQFNLIGDPIRLKQIFLNLIENIVKVSGFPLNIGIDVVVIRKSDQLVQLSFSVKCPVLHIVKFDENNYFVKNPNHSVEGEENFLDLGIAHKIVKLFNGELRFEPHEKYSQFKFHLDFIPDTKKENETPNNESDYKAPILFSSDKKINVSDANVLLVEDNAINQKIVILSLRGFVKNIDVAFNGKEALDKFGKSRYDLILMDIQMPIMNGIIATKKIRELEAATNTHVPIIAITANALSGDKEACLSAGMNDYISKPFQIEMLLNKMKNLLE